MKPIKMVDLHGQYLHIKSEIDIAIQQVIDETAFINGSVVATFNQALASYHNVKYAHSCGNGTDALQIALMALDLEKGDEIIMPAFTYFATVEVVLLLGLKPVFVDVNADTFNIDVTQIEAAITPKTKAIIPVHLFGQCADMESIMNFANNHNLFVIEDNAQAIGSSVQFSDGTIHKSGSMGHMACTSFFPSKNLGCYGDGGALTTNDEKLYQKIKMIANHGQQKKYHHEIVGINSRLDSIQAAILLEKIKHLDQYNKARQTAANEYSKGFEHNTKIKTPFIANQNTHVFHQYTIQLSEEINRDDFKNKLTEKGIPTMIYYPISCHLQKAYLDKYPLQLSFPISERLSKQVISLPMHTELEEEQINFIIETINQNTL